MSRPYNDRANCPLHLIEPCPPGCDYWTKSDAVDAKVASGICCRVDCDQPATVGQVCEPCSKIVRDILVRMPSPPRRANSYRACSTLRSTFRTVAPAHVPPRFVG